MNEPFKAKMSDDSISRQAAIDAILHNQEMYLDSFGKDPLDRYAIAIIDNDAQTIAQLPPAQPDLKVGEWIDEPVYKQTMDGKTWDGFTYCSECKEMHKYGYRSNYCPDCGAQMNERRE